MYKVIRTTVTKEFVISPDHGGGLRILFVENETPGTSTVRYDLYVLDFDTGDEQEAVSSTDYFVFLYQVGVLLAGTYGTDVAVLAWDFLFS
ncbi:hypothetical protein LCGC14_0995300 [marine sediment metagenome]|uniref:Uncharacterized protein n=1 Tax=marine sediment metagenome TaxID=412755 RepID=A0A0F9NR18_9ZZZZ